MAPKIVVVADDLTGALDSAAPFAARGLSAIVACKPSKFSDALTLGVDVVAVATGTREGDAQTAGEVLRHIGTALEDYAGFIFKKIDSRMKGNIAAEVVVLSGLRTGRALVCPAIPRLDRFVENGAIVGAGVDAPIKIAPHFASLPVDIADARADADIDLAIEDAPKTRLYIGAAGLAEALARKMAPEGTMRHMPKCGQAVMLTVGSRDPVTTRQVEVLESADLPMQNSKAPNGVVSPWQETPQRLSMCQIVPGDEEISSSKAARDFAQGIAQQVRAAKPDSLFISGGESASTILTTLGITMLEVNGEILPGVPCATARDGAPGLVIITKSGGFGGPQTLVDLCRKLISEA